jgi:hypothetical protein
MKKTKRKKRKSLKDKIIDWFNKPIEVKSILKTKAPVKARDNVGNKAKKTGHSKSKAKLKEKLKAETLARAEVEKRLKEEIKAREKAEAILKAERKKQQVIEPRPKKLEVKDKADGEEKIRACAKEIKDCIDQINKSSGGSEAKPNRESEHPDIDKIGSKAGSNARKGKSTGGRDDNGNTKSSGQGVCPAEMAMLLAKAEKNISKAVIKAKEKDEQKAKRARRKS